MDALRNLWDAREPRERVLLMIMFGLIALLVLSLGVVRPVLAAKTAAQDKLLAAQNDYTLVTRALPALSGQTQDSPAKPFQRGQLSALARARGVKLTRVQPDGDASVSVWVDNVPTDALYGFFEDLLSGYDVRMTRASVNAAPGGGLSAQFTLTY